MIKNKVACLRATIGEDIHELIFMETSRRAVEEYFIHLDDIACNSALDRPIRILTDGSQIKGVQPMGHTMSHARQILSIHTVRPPIKLAIIVGRKEDTNLMYSLFRTLMRWEDGLRFFYPDQQNEAIDWLLR